MFGILWLSLCHAQLATLGIQFIAVVTVTVDGAVITHLHGYTSSALVA